MRVQVLALLASSLAALGSARMPAFAPAKDRLENREWAYDAHEIDQLSDRYVLHMNGTFKQRYFFDKSFYKPGGPLFLYIGGETNFLKIYGWKDFAATISFPMGGPISYPTYTLQEINSVPGYGEPWTGLGGYAAYYVKTDVVSLCTSGRIDSTDYGCFSTHNTTYYADPSNSNTRSYRSTLTDEIRISSDDYPSYLIMDAGHVWDGRGIRDVVKEPQFIREAHLWEIRIVGRFFLER
ncbi:hypothetical protein PSV09DRAFT_18077 [Bipolaris maydis]|nr:hypothetical protein PSV09DRAFT_18077 [Bipolaris maydis]